MKTLRILLVIFTLFFNNNLFGKSTYSIYISEGMSFYKLGEYDKAIQNFEKAIELNPNDPLPYRMIGLSYYRKEQLNYAIEYLCKSMILEKEDNIITLSIIGNIYYKQKKYNNSTIVYERLTSLTNSAFITYRLMNSLEKVGRLEEAVKVGEKFLSSPTWEDFDQKTFKSYLRTLYVKLANNYKKEDKKELYERVIQKAKSLE